MKKNGFRHGNSLIFHGDNADIINRDIPDELDDKKIDLTFLDPPFNQNKEYENHQDSMDEDQYWEWMKRVCEGVYNLTADGGSIYFMQREKKTKQVLQTLRETGWTLQNLIIWKKKTSAVPQIYRFGKQYQIIAFATKGDRPKVFNRVRIDYPLAPGQKVPRKNGIFVTDVWDDIREMTSGFFAGEEALRNESGERAHKQQSPVGLLLRIILSSTLPGDMVFDPFAGTGTTLVVANQLNRFSIGVELGKGNYDLICKRLKEERTADAVDLDYYRFSDKIDSISGIEPSSSEQKTLPDFSE